MNHLQRSGFSLVELMIVMGCMGFLFLLTTLLVIAGYNLWM